MKKLFCMLCAVAALTVQICVPVSAASRYNKYTSSGLKAATDCFDNRFSAIACPGAIVYADANIFTDLIAKQPHNEISGYACFGNQNRAETLTLGVVFADGNPYYNRELLDAYVYEHIDYIKNIGGKMTGYTKYTEYDTRSKAYIASAINISWDVDGMHHYARFEPDFQVIGYYDLAFPTGSSVQKDIPYMNENFYCAFEYQG